MLFIQDPGGAGNCPDNILGARAACCEIAARAAQWKNEKKAAPCPYGCFVGMASTPYAPAWQQQGCRQRRARNGVSARAIALLSRFGK